MPEEYEDVEATLQQDTAPDTSQQKRKWRSIDWIAGTTLAAEVLMSLIWAILWLHECRFEHQLQVYFASVLIILTGGYLTLIFCPIFKKDDDPRWFHARILSSGIVGGSYAFLLPAVMGLEEGSVTSGGAAALRQAILLATGGLIGLIALGETRRKNDNDREAAESLQKHQQDTLTQQKKQFEEQLEKQQKQFEANAYKDRKAERRERYTKAIEQLGDEKSSVRMGGVYTLVGLVDEWLEEENLSENKRLKEGQVIINNLCAYIRSPFTLASHYDELKQDNPGTEGVYQDKVQEFYADKATLNSEADVRLGINKEIHDRLRGLKEETPGTWSYFEYDFSGSTFFYPVDLSYSYYLKSITFDGSTYQDWTNFSNSIYEGSADFSRSIYKNEVYFSSSKYGDNAYFSHSIYQGEAIFRRCEHKGSIIFKESIYGGNVDFEKCIYGSRNINNLKVDFTNSIYISDVDFSATEYNFSADCSNSIYCGKINFSDSTYFQSANFENSIYNQEVNIVATYEDSTYFNGSIFYNSVHFNNPEVIHSYGADKSYWIDKTAKFTKYPPHFSYTCGSSELEYEELYEELYIKYGDPDVSFFYNFTIRTLFGEHKNSFDVSQNYEYTLERNSKNLPLHCDLLTSSQKEYLEDKFKIIKSVFNGFLKGKNPRENEFYLDNLKSITKELHKWREKATLKATPEIHKFYENNILENPEG